MVSKNERQSRNSRLPLGGVILIAWFGLLASVPNDLRAQGKLSPADLLRNAFGLSNSNNANQPAAANAPNPVRIGNAGQSVAGPLAGFGTAPFDLAMLGPLFEASDSGVRDRKWSRTETTSGIVFLGR